MSGTTSCPVTAGMMFDCSIGIAGVWMLRLTILPTCIAMHWYPHRRLSMEQPLLDRYHAALLESGVQGYERAALAQDYRLAVLWQTTTPI